MSLEPDAYSWIESFENLKGEHVDSLQHSEEHPSHDSVQFYMSDDHEYSNVRPLLLAETMEEELNPIRDTAGKGLTDDLDSHAALVKVRNDLSDLLRQLRGMDSKTTGESK